MAYRLKYKPFWKLTFEFNYFIVWSFCLVVLTKFCYLNLSNSTKIYSVLINFSYSRLSTIIMCPPTNLDTEAEHPSNYTQIKICSQEKKATSMETRLPLHTKRNFIGNINQAYNPLYSKMRLYWKWIVSLAIKATKVVS